MATSGLYETIAVSVAGPVATVLLDQAERRNAFSKLMDRELGAAITALDADDDIRAIVVGASGRDFCVGADLDADVPFKARDDAPSTNARRFWQLGTPLIAAISGAAIGVGITFPLELDIRVADEDARIAFAFTRLGVVPERNALWLLTRLVGAARAVELLITGRTISGREAADIGLVSGAVPSGTALVRAAELAEQIATRTAPVAVALTKRAFYELLAETDREHAEERTIDLFAWSVSQPDAREGVAAFLAKRAPAWPLRKNADFPAAAFAGRAAGVAGATAD